MKIMVFLLSIILVSGCVARTYTIEKPRKDIEITGNRGYLTGGPKGPLKEPKKTRPVSVLEIELGGAKPPREVEKAVTEEPKEIARLEDIEKEIIKEEPQIIEGIAEQPLEYEYYTVQKNDTLQKISSKFYGTTKKWKFLYETNKDVLKGPDKIYPGQKIKIPILQ